MRPAKHGRFPARFQLQCFLQLATYGKKFESLFKRQHIIWRVCNLPQQTRQHCLVLANEILCSNVLRTSTRKSSSQFMLQLHLLVFFPIMLVQGSRSLSNSQFRCAASGHLFLPLPATSVVPSAHTAVFPSDSKKFKQTGFNKALFQA
jgi:hypothetical protein